MFRRERVFRPATVRVIAQKMRDDSGGIQYKVILQDDPLWHWCDLVELRRDYLGHDRFGDPRSGLPVRTELR